MRISLGIRRRCPYVCVIWESLKAIGPTSYLAIKINLIKICIDLKFLYHININQLFLYNLNSLSRGFMSFASLSHSSVIRWAQLLKAPSSFSLIFLNSSNSESSWLNAFSLSVYLYSICLSTSSWSYLFLSKSF